MLCLVQSQDRIKKYILTKSKKQASQTKQSKQWVEIAQNQTTKNSRQENALKTTTLSLYHSITIFFSNSNAYSGWRSHIISFFFFNLLIIRLFLCFPGIQALCCWWRVVFVSSFSSYASSAFCSSWLPLLGFLCFLRCSKKKKSFPIGMRSRRSPRQYQI